VLSGFEASVRESAKDEADWQRIRAMIYSEPPEVAAQRRAEQRATAATGAATPSAPPGRGGISMAQMQALIAQASAEEAIYGG
jgi:hypothetical protein